MSMSIHLPHSGAKRVAPLPHQSRPKSSEDRNGDVMATHEILTVAEIAVELRCSKAHVYNVIAGKVDGVHPLPAICMGRRKLVRRAILEEWKKKNESRARDANMASSSAIDSVGRMKEKTHA